MVLVTKNGPTVTARDLLLHIRVSGGDDANGGDGADSRDAEKISPHFTERLASAFDMDEREKRRRRIMGNGSYGPMDPATGRYQWLDSVNLLGVASAIAKSLKKRKSGAENTGPPTMVRRITITYSQTTPDEGSRIRSAEVRLDVTPPRPFDH
jgi:hypothetical protein